MNPAGIGAIERSDVQGIHEILVHRRRYHIGAGDRRQRSLIRTFTWLGRPYDEAVRLISKDAPANFVLSLHAFIIEGVVGLGVEVAAATAGAAVS